MWRGFVLLGDGAADFCEFLHQVVPCVKAAGSVAEEVVRFVSDGFLVGAEADGGGIGIWRAFDDWQAEAFAPALELFDGGGAEGICGGEDDWVALFFEPVAELGGGGGLAGAIDPDDEDDEGFAIWTRCERGCIGGKAGGELFPSHGDDVVSGYLAAEFFKFLDDGAGETDAEVGGDEIGLDVIPVDLGAVGDLVEERFEKACHGFRCVDSLVGMCGGSIVA